MSASYLLEKYQPPKNQAPSKVRRFPLFRRSALKPAAAIPPAKETPKEEKPAQPTFEWSDWQFIKEPQWEGYWRASAQEDGKAPRAASVKKYPGQALTENTGGWHYHFTTDGKTVWEQKVPKPEAPKPSPALAKTDGERVLFGEIPATAFTTAHVKPQAPSSRPTTITAGDSMSPPYSIDTTHSSLSHDPRSLTMKGHSTSEAHATLRAQASPSTNSSRKKRTSQRQDRDIGAKDSNSSRKVISNYSDSHRSYSIVYSKEARPSRAASASQEAWRDYHASHKKRQGHHGALARSWEAGSHQNSIGEIVSAEKKKQFDAKKIVDSWQWG